MNFSLAYDRQLTEPAANLVITGDEIAQAHLSVANRTARNRSGLYQKKHDPQAIANPAVGERTRDRSPDHAALNRTIDEHYQLLLSKHQLNQDASTLVFTISDLTANPMRPHYDNSVVPEQYAYTIANGRYPDGSDARLFYLEDEPLSQIPYTLLIAYEQAGQPCITIQHQVRLNGDGTLPPTIPTTIKNGLKWWAACPPLLIDGKHVPEQYAALDYDVRHTFGFPQTPEVKKALKQLYIPFPNWQEWNTTIRQKLAAIPQPGAQGYNAALGVAASDSPKNSQLIIVHRYSTIAELAEQIHGLGAQNAILLDSGGSCAIWANWANGNQGAVLASHFNFRPRRGAVVFLQLKGRRYPED